MAQVNAAWNAIRGPMVPPAWGPSLNILPIQYNTFQELYSDESKDPWKGEYCHILQCFNPDNWAPLASKEQVVGLCTDHLQAYLGCQDSSDGPRIYCLHTPSYYVPALYGMMAPWDNYGFASLETCTKALPPLFISLAFLFDVIGPVSVCLPARIAADLEQAETGPHALPPLPEDNEANTQVLTRHFMYPLRASFSGCKRLSLGRCLAYINASYRRWPGSRRLSTPV